MLPKREKLLQTGLALHAFASAITLAVFAWQGFFSRYMADDYCHSGLLKAYGFWGAIQHHYLTFSNRYMILVVPFITDLFGVRGQSWLPAMLIILWLVALYWLFSEMALALNLDWSRLLRFVLAGQLAFFTIFQAPNRYQSIYWEASSINRFVPLVLTTFLFASLFFVIRNYAVTQKPFWWSLLFFVATFLIGGFDEMNDVLIFAVAFLALVGIFVWGTKDEKRSFKLWLLGSVFLSSLLSIGVMSLSPGITWRVGEAPTFMVFLQRIFTYPLDFIIDVLRRQPLPSFILLAISFVIFALRKEKLILNKKLIFSFFFIAPLLLYSILLVNFAPSAYAQAYPADRALLGAQALMTLLLIVEGGLLGTFFAEKMSAVALQYLLLLFLIFSSLYPLRAAWLTENRLDFYRERAVTWDERDAQIRAEITNGATEIIVTEFDSLHGIKEIDEDPNHWVNRCAAEYYGVETITAVLP